MISASQGTQEGIALTWAERTIWLASAISVNPTAYNAACIVTIEGDIEPSRLIAAIRQAVSIGGLAAVKVALNDGELQWRAAKAPPVLVDGFDHEALCLADGFALLSEVFRTDPIRGDASHLIRVHIVKVRTDQILVMFRHHHVLLDFYAMAALVRNVEALYGGEGACPRDNHRREIVSAEHIYLASDMYSEDKRYWRARMAGMSASALWLPLQQHSSGSRCDLTVPADEFATFVANARALGATPFQALLLIAYTHLSGERDDDVVFGVPFANRAADHTQALASMSRIVPFRVRFAQDTLARTALAHVRSTLKEDLTRARFPIWENAEHVFRGALHGALPRIALNYMRASPLKFGAATGAITKVLYGERNAETYIRCIEEADDRLSISIDDANDRQVAESLGGALRAGIFNWRVNENTTIGALLGG